MSQIEELNLEEGYPRAEEAEGKFRSGLQSAKTRGVALVKVIHGWGSHGSGGALKRVVKRQLPDLLEKGLVKEWIYGDAWKVTSPVYLEWFGKYPVLRDDRDLNRNNPGITWVRLR